MLKAISSHKTTKSKQIRALTGYVSLEVAIPTETVTCNPTTLLQFDADGDTVQKKVYKFFCFQHRRADTHDENVPQLLGKGPGPKNEKVVEIEPRKG